MSLSGSQKAYQYALSGAFRSGASRSGYISARTFIDIGGITLPPRTDSRQPGVLYDSIYIQDILNERSNTCSFRTWLYKPALGSTVTIRLGSKAAAPLFAGTIIDRQQSYDSKPANLIYSLNCIDWGWRLNKQVTVAQYRSQSATAIIADLMATWAPTGYTVKHLEANLAPLDEITFTNERLGDCLSRIAARVGGYWYIDYQKDLHFFTTADTDVPAVRPLTPTHPTLSSVTREDDISQMITRVVMEGGGGTAVTTVPPGATAIPIDVPAWYEPAGGMVISGPQRIRYTSVQGLTGGGSLVGPGVTPSAPLNAVAITGAGIEVGAHEYGYTWTTAGGETPPSPIPANAQATAITKAGIRLADPTTAPGAYQVYMTPGYSSLTVGWAYSYIYTWLFSHAGVTGETINSPATPFVVLTAGNGAFHLTVPNPTTQIPEWLAAPGGGGYIVTYRSDNYAPYHAISGTFIRISNDPGALWHLTDFGPVSTGESPGPWPDYPLNSAQLPDSRQVALSSISLGPAGTTGRKLYRSLTNTSGLKYLATIPNNTATTYTDSSPDSALGAAAPTGDTSGLDVAAGQVTAAQTSILCASTVWAAPTGGWAVIGNGQQTIRYTGISGNTLTGIPSSGFGSVTAAISYNSTITAAASLEGVPASGDGSIRYEILEGDSVNIWIQLTDDIAVANLAALLGDDGIQVEYVQDRRYSVTECRARCEALLRHGGVAIAAVRYTSRDINTRSGSTIVADLPEPTAIQLTMKAQQVTISNFSHLPGHYPLFAVTASNERYSFEDLLRNVLREPK